MPIDFTLSISGRQKIAIENMINRDYHSLIDTFRSNDLHEFSEEELRELVSQLDMALSLKQSLRESFDNVYDKTKGVTPDLPNNFDKEEKVNHESIIG